MSYKLMAGEKVMQMNHQDVINVVQLIQVQLIQTMSKE